MQFRDLNRQYHRLKPGIDRALFDVINTSTFIGGEPVRELEQRLAGYVGVKHCISCGNGTDAISIMLISHGIGEAGGGSREDAVFVPDFTFFSTGECPATCGATPVFVDVRPDTYNMDAASLQRALESVIDRGDLTPKAVIAVDLFGLPADYDAIADICNRYEVLLLEDGAQGFGGVYHGKRACSLGTTATTSFFPAKPLGCYGDGGAIFTDDDDIADLCRSIAVHGKDMSNPSDPESKYNNKRLGMNSRLDTIQAAILMEKLKAFDEYELDTINIVAKWYENKLSGLDGVRYPVVQEGFYSSWAQYTIQLADDVDRAALQAYMKKAGIPTMVYYIKPMHRQRAFAGTVSEQADCPKTDYLCDHVLCLPIHPYMTEKEVDVVVDTLCAFFET